MAEKMKSTDGAKSSEAPGSTENTATGEMISSKAPGTVQQSNIIIQTVNIIGENDSIGGIANHQNEVKDGQGSSSTKRSRLEDWDTVTEASRTSQPSVAYSQPGTMNYSGVGASSGIIHNQQNTTNNYNSNNEGNSSSKTSQPVDIDKLDCTRLKTYYSTSLCQASPLPWYPGNTWSIGEVYTELALENPKTPKFGVEGLFKQWDKHKPKGGSSRILIEGDAGYGKSTLMLKMASDWSESDSKHYISRFSLLLVVKLGHVGEDGDILSNMEKDYKKMIKNMDTSLEDVLESEGAKKVLILLDGYDEANAKTKEAVGRIMVKKDMIECHVVLASRCGHVPDDVKGRALPVRVTGFGARQVAVAVGKFFIKAGHFTKAEVKNCIDKAVPPRDFDSELNDAILPSIDDFKSVEGEDPLLPVDKRLRLEQFNEFVWQLLAESPYKDLAQCPLLCVMMCCLVSECPNGELPSTVSGLYFAMINRNLYRAAIKKTRRAGEVEEQWDLSDLDSRIVEGHENKLQEFGRLCVEGLKTGRMTFSLLDITGKKEAAKTTDVKVTQLIKAGVLVQDTNVRNPRYQVPHRTTAEFLAAYCLSREIDENLCQQNLLDLYRLKASFDEVAASLVEMGKPRCLVDAFFDIKFPSEWLFNIPFMKSYFTQHGAAGTWSEFKDALPNKLITHFEDHSEREQNAYLGVVTISSDKPSQTLLQLVEGPGLVDTGNKNALRSRSEDCQVSLDVLKFGRFDALLFPILFRTVLKSGVVLSGLKYAQDFLSDGEIINYQMCQESARSLEELLKADFCPVQLSFTHIPISLQLAVTEAMQKVPEACRLKCFAFFQVCNPDSTQLWKVLAEKWLSHLQHLGMGSKKWGSGDKVNPVLKRLREPGCSLTLLHLRNYGNRNRDNKGGPLLDDLMMLASKLETLSLENMNFQFDVTEMSKYVVKEKCSLKSLHLKNVSLTLDGSLPSADEKEELIHSWRNVAQNLEELTIDGCEFPFGLFSWLNLSIPKLRTFSIGAIYRKMPNNDKEFYANQLLGALTKRSGDNIEELSLLKDFWESRDELMLHPIREALQRCPRMKRVNLGIGVEYDLSKISIRPDPSIPVSSTDEQALKSDNIALALLEIVLSVPMLQTLTSEFFFRYWKEIGTFHIIADKAEKWPGKTKDKKQTTTNDSTLLTLHGLSNKKACHARHVFLERKLEYRLRYVEDKVYELWFPV